MSKFAMPVVILLVGAIGYSQSPGPSPSSTKLEAQSRRSADRPTALPEDKDLADQFAKAAAGYITQVQILRMAKMDLGNNLSLGNWLYFNAIDLSDPAFAKAQFTKYYQELGELNEQVNRAYASGDKEKLKLATNALLASINQRLEEGDRLFSKYEKTFNTVTQNPDGSFTVQLRQRPNPSFNSDSSASQ